MNSPSDQICMGRNQLIIVGDRRIYEIPTKRRNLQTTTTAAPMIVDGSIVTASLQMKTLGFTSPASDSFFASPLSCLCLSLCVMMISLLF